MNSSSLYQKIIDQKLCPLPIADNKGKNPTLAGWGNWTILPTEEEINQWKGTAVGILCGKISRNLEVIDFDEKNRKGIYEDWKALLPDSSILDKYTISKTVNNGYHLLYFCEETEGNKKLACSKKITDPNNPKKFKVSTWIETRGEGGYVLEEPSEGYKFIQGDLSSIPHITDEERHLLFATAAMLNELESEKARFVPAQFVRVHNSDDLRPGDDFNSRALWKDILGPHGWAIVKTWGKKVYWKRYGKEDKGHSAIENYNDDDTLCIFSSSTIFEINKLYSKFQAYTLLNHNGDFRGSAKELASKGYGGNKNQTATAITALMGGAAELPLSDRTNAEEFINDHQEIIRYCYQLKSWLVWNGERWMPDATEEVMTMADTTLKRLAGILETLPNEDQKKSYRSHIKNSLSRRGFDGMIRLAEWNRRVVITEKELDVNLWRLNCLNGEIDLKTGELLPHNKESYFTKVCPVNYVTGAKLDLWDSFLLRVLPNENTRRFVQRAVGYTLTGAVSEEKLFFAYGGTATGKSTFLGALYNVLGDFAVRADFETFIAKDKQNDAPRIDLARLAHKRFVMSLEVDDGKKLAQGLVKQITGGDVMTARFLYKEHFEFVPTFKLWFASNHQPAVSADDEAMWRRIVQIPFTTSIPKEEQDLTLKERLQDMSISGSAILAWAVEGCLDWQKNGLGIPPQVQATTAAYRREMDSVQDFIEEYCETGENMKEKFSLLWNAYQDWEYRNKIQQKTGRKQFAQKLTNLGFEEDASIKRGRARKGIKILQQIDLNFENEFEN